MGQWGVLDRRVVATAALAAALAWLALFWIDQAPPVETPTSKPSGAAADYGKLPLSFEPNLGQTAAKVDFVSRGSGAALSLTAGGALIQLDSKRGARVIGFEFVGADRSAQAAGLERLPGEVNTMVGQDRSQWRTDIPTYGRVRYESVYPGVDVDWYGRQGRLEHDFRLAPGADPDRLAMRVAGADSVRLARNGDLIIGASGKAVRQRAPVAYQEIDGARRSVSAAYELDGKVVSFRLGRYDRSAPLVIDPQYLIYSTYVGGGFDDFVRDVAVDSSGSAHLVGYASGGFPTTVGAYREANAFGFDVVVAKLNPAGSAMEYATYIGGTDGTTGDDFGEGIEVDSSGTIYVVGTTTNSDYPTVNEFQDGTADGNTVDDDDAFLSVFNPDPDNDDPPVGGDDNDLLYSTYISDAGGANDRIGEGSSLSFGHAGLDTANVPQVVTVAGTTEGASFPVTDGVGDNDALDDALGGSSDAFVARFDTTASGAASLDYSTYLGGTGAEFGHDVDRDNSGITYVAGRTSGGGLTTTGTPFDSTAAGTDGFVARLNDTTGTSGLLDSTYFGGSGFDSIAAIAVPEPGQVAITGHTDSSVPAYSFPGGYRETDVDPGANEFDVFVSKLDLLTTPPFALDYSTFLGGSGDDIPTDMALDLTDQPVVSGRVDDGPDFPVTGGAVDTTVDGTRDAFLSRISLDSDNDDPPASGDDNDLLYSTLFGGAGTETDGGVAVDKSGFAYLGTTTLSSNYVTTPGAFQTARPGAFNEVGLTKLWPYPVIDGNPLNIAVDSFGHIEASIDGEPEAEVDFSGGFAQAGLAIAFTEALDLVGFTAAGNFSPISPPTLSVNGNMFELTQTYGASPDGDETLNITETHRYINGETTFTTTWTIQNSPSSPGNIEFRPTVGADLNIDGDDLGVGRFASPPRFIGSLFDPYQTGNGLEEMPGTPWSAYEEGSIANIDSDINQMNTPGLDNVVDESLHDTAVAAQWDDHSTPATALTPGGATATYSVRWAFRRVPPPVHAQRFVVRPAGGAVFLRAPGQSSFYRLTDERRIPVGSLVDVRNGFVELDAQNASGAVETATFWSGLFEAQQQSGGPFNARLAEDLNCGRSKKKKKKKNKGRTASTSATARASAASRQLWARAKGRFRTTGYKGSATIRGTEWLTIDRCAGKKRTTQFRVVEGQIEIDDFSKKGAVNKLLGAGKQFTAGKPKKRKKKGK